MGWFENLLETKNLKLNERTLLHLTSPQLIEGHWEPSGLNTDKLRRSLYSETFEGEINGRGTFESPPKEEVFED